jgi:hypothetical protein
MATTLNGAISLGLDAYWEDEHKWTANVQTVRRTLSGGVVVERLFDPVTEGRPMTVLCPFIQKSVVDSLIALRDGQSQGPWVMAFHDRQGTYEVIFRHEDGEPVEVLPRIPRPNHESTDRFNVRLKLMVV